MSQPLNISEIIDRQSLAIAVSDMWSSLNNERQGWLNEMKEKRNYLFATDTSTTSVSETTDWNNTVNIPKLTQIRDNLHANYMAALFPNDNWLKWESHSNEEGSILKRKAILAYMSNKVRISDFMQQVSLLVLDYIDNGNPVYDITYINEEFTDPETKETLTGYVGPRLVRINIEKIVFDGTAPTFRASPKITRTLMSLGSLASMLKNQPGQGWAEDVIKKAQDFRGTTIIASLDDSAEVEAFEIDGFGSLSKYLTSGLLEILEFEGDIYDEEKNELLENQIITVVDRSFIARQITQPAWQPRGHKGHTAWRKRPHGLLGMGPLDNLVGMQHAIDKLNNGKLDALDLNIHPPLITVGEVPPESTDLRPKAHIHINSPQGQVIIPRPDLTAINANVELQYMMDLMEQMAGAPREAMGIRTPGEKTAFEVSTLTTAAGRIFQEKVSQFEREILEPALNSMLEVAKRNISGAEVTRVFDDDLGVETFLKITKEDITAKGKLRPRGGRHFSQDAQTIQTMTVLMNGPVGEIIRPHISGKNLARAFEQLTNLDRFEIIEVNAAVFEAGETNRLAQEDQVQQDIEAGVDPNTPIEDGAT